MSAHVPDVGVAHAQFRPTFPSLAYLSAPARVRVVSDPHLSGDPEPVESVLPARLRSVDPTTGRVVYSPDDADWITATAPIDAAQVMRGRGWVPLSDILGNPNGDGSIPCG